LLLHLSLGLSLVEKKYKLNFFEPRIFVVTLIFTFISGIRNGFQPYLYVILLDYGYGILEIGIVSSIIGELFFLINPVLFYITLFFICEQNLLIRIASTIVSLVTGSLMGYWSGGLTGAYYVYVAVHGEGFAGVMLNLAYQIPHSIASTALVGFAMVALAWITTKWSEALKGLEVPSEKPYEIVVASILYVVSGVLTFCVIPLLMALDPLKNLLFKNLLVSYGLVTLILVGTISQLIIGYGLYGGKRWGWALTFMCVLSGIAISVNHIVLYEHFGLFQIILHGITLALNVIVLLVLFESDVRLYCRFVNPSVTQQE
jgi:cytochrome c oxidase subunit IV